MVVGGIDLQAYATDTRQKYLSKRSVL